MTSAASSTTGTLSSKAVSGFANAALYDEHRPSYPSDAVTILLDAAVVDGVDGARVVDLAAGTGKFTELLSARKERFSVLAVEPHAEMRAHLAAKAFDNVTVSDGLSTAIPAESETADAVFAAQVRSAYPSQVPFFPFTLLFFCHLESRCGSSSMVPIRKSRATNHKYTLQPFPFSSK